SEANELAIRLARACTGRRDLLVLDAAYHGNTTTLIDASPYKHAGPGGGGAPDWVHTAPLADDYRGPYRRGDPEAGARYAADAARIIEGLGDAPGARGRQLAGFLAESCPSVGGQIMFPAGYLAGVYQAVRRAGGVCIADEVQTGLGRIGTHLWAFEAQGVVPDIVVMGKPLGNGHPLAAVVTTRAIADVRGSGLFLGVELVDDRTTLAPAAAAADYVANRMRDRGILIGTDGPHHNVLKIRPPMPFDRADAARLVETLDDVLGEL